MFCEIETTWQTLRRESCGAFVNKIRSYFHQLLCWARFYFLGLSRNATSEALVDFSFNAAGGLLKTAQIRSEIIQLADLIGKHRPKNIVEIGATQGNTLFLWCRQTDPAATIVSLNLPGGIHDGGYPDWKSWIYQWFLLAMHKLHPLCGIPTSSKCKRGWKACGRITAWWIFFSLTATIPTML